MTTVFLKDIARVNEINIDKNYRFDEIEYIDIASVDKGRVLEIRKLNRSDAPSRAQRIVRDNDILLSTVRPNLKHFAFINTASKNMIASTGFAVISAKKVDPRFLYYYLTTNKYTDFLAAIADAHTTTYPAFNPDVLENSEIPFPSLEEQKEIGKILSDLDAKIDLNYKMNKTLESIAQALFKRWFVDFEFPGHEKIEIIDDIPEGWEKISLIDVVDVLGGGTPSTTESSYWGKETPFFTPKDAPVNCYVIETEKEITLKGLENCNSQKYPRNTVFITARGTVGKVCMAGCDMAMNQSCYAIRGKGGSEQQYYIYHLIKSLSDQLTQNAHGTVFETITTETFRKIQVIHPLKSILNLFINSIEPFYDRILSNIQETRKLAQIRDSLLPILMSGKIKVID